MSGLHIDMLDADRLHRLADRVGDIYNWDPTDAECAALSAALRKLADAIEAEVRSQRPGVPPRAALLALADDFRHRADGLRVSAEYAVSRHYAQHLIVEADTLTRCADRLVALLPEVP